MEARADALRAIFARAGARAKASFLHAEVGWHSKRIRHGSTTAQLIYQRICRAEAAARREHTAVDGVVLWRGLSAETWELPWGSRQGGEDNSIACVLQPVCLTTYIARSIVGYIG